MENREKAGEGICIVSFDGGGPGSLSQLRILDELMHRLAFKPGVKVDDLLPADYFDLMGGVGFGGLVALLLGRLRMTTSQATDELATIGTEIFPEGDGTINRKVNMARLRHAIESMLERHGHPVGIQLHDGSHTQCKVVLFAATTAIMDHCHPFRTYVTRLKDRQCTFVDAACATMALPEYFSSVAIGPRLREQNFAGIPYGFDNPMREVLKESQLVFGKTTPVSLVLSLGSGQRTRLSELDQHVTRLSRKGTPLSTVEFDDWSKLGSIEAHTEVYLEMNPIIKYIDKACQWLRQRNGSVTLGQLSGTDTGYAISFRSENLKDCSEMEFKRMNDVIQQLEIERIILVDASGMPIRIPLELCRTYDMLLDRIKVHFKDQKVPESDFVARGDYRLVHGDRKKIMGQMEWVRINKVGLKLEMSVILRTRNQNSASCPSCSTSFEGSAIDGWAQCLFCSTQFQIETLVQVEPQDRSEDTAQSGEDTTMELETPGVKDSESSHKRRRRYLRSYRNLIDDTFPQVKERQSIVEAGQLQFRLISVINIKAVNFGLRLLQYYSGKTLEAQTRTMRKIEEYRELHNRSPITLIGPQGQRGGEIRLHWQCNICGRDFNTFQKVAVHLTSREWGLANWQCLEIACDRVYQSRNELVRHKTSSHANARSDEYEDKNAATSPRIARPSTRLPTGPLYSQTTPISQISDYPFQGEIMPQRPFALTYASPVAVPQAPPVPMYDQHNRASSTMPHSQHNYLDRWSSPHVETSHRFIPNSSQNVGDVTALPTMRGPVTYKTPSEYAIHGVSRT